MMKIKEINSRAVEVSLVFIVSVFLGLVWNYLAGKNLDWDSLNYHFYGAHALFEQRMGQDFFAAGGQGYLNPIAHIPFYLMVKSGIHSLLVGSVLAIIHSLNFLFLYLITGEIVGWGNKNLQGRVLGFSLGVVSLPVWHLIGTSFSDLTVLVPQLASVYIALLAYRKKRKSLWFVSGLLMGASAGLKLTGILPCVLLAVAMIGLLARRRKREDLESLVLCGVGGILGFCLLHGWWSFLLWGEFKNPFFPLFNGIFKSPFYLSESSPDSRFLSDDLYSLLIFPLKMLLSQAWVYYEKIAPDIRFSVGLTAFVCCCFRLLIVNREKSREIIWVALLFWVGFYFWAFVSGNARYGLIFLVLIGPVTYGVVSRLAKDRYAKPIVLMVIFLQLVCSYMNGAMRWTESQWTDEWYPFVVPESLVERDYLILTADGISFSFLVDDLNVESSLVKIGGGMFFSPEVLGRLDRLRLARGGRLKGLFKYEMAVIDDKKVAFMVDQYRPVFHRAGYDVVEDSCELIYEKPGNVVVDVKKMLSCSLVYDASIRETFDREAVRYDRIFNNFQTACGNTIKFKSNVTRKKGNIYYRSDAGTGYSVFVGGDDGVYVRRYRSLNMYYMGAANEWDGSAGSNFDDVSCRLGG